MELNSPHIPLGISSSEVKAILRGLASGADITTQEDGSLTLVHCAIKITAYITEGVVTSVWYNDPLGRETSLGQEEKVAAYLARYGRTDAWECRMENGWMRYWYNAKANVSMVYGIHKDVIRFNVWHPPKGVA